MACLWQLFFHVITLVALTVHHWLRSGNNGGKSYITANLVDWEDPKTGKVVYATLRSGSTFGSLYSIEN